ncbi:MAG: carbohydrate-binding domain-containing protein [Lachnospiraceae bacterium]|nr:carbohydrate-binding domain-containing protein [Lachnospiraceae bacterium]
MSSSKLIDKICIAITIAAVLITVLFMNGEKLGLTKVVDEDSESYEESDHFTANDLDGKWDTDGATSIVMNGTTARINGSGAYVKDGSVYISGGGKYVVSGELSDGQLVVEAYQNSKVWILLNGVDIYCSDNAGISVVQADKVFLTLAEGTVNTVTTGSEYSDSALTDNVNAAIYTHDDLTVNGSGSLDIKAGYYHGIKAKDDFVITGGTITIECPADAVHVNDDFKFANAALTIDAGDDAIHSDTGIYVESGEILINTCYEGLEALIINIAGGDITMYPTDDGLNANGYAGSGFGGGGFEGGGGSMGNREDMFTELDEETLEKMKEAFENGERPERPEMNFEENGERPERPEMNFEENGERSERPDSEASVNEASDSDEEESYVIISGGSITIINEDANDADGIDSNGSVYIYGGNIFVSLNGNGSNNAIDYGSENGGVCEVYGGTVMACGGSAMAENFDASSTQASFMYNTDSISAGSQVTLKDSAGKLIMDYEIPCSFTSLMMSSPDMKVGETYTLTMGDTAVEITLDDYANQFGTSEGGMEGGMGGMGGFGGGRGFGGHGGRENSDSQ